MYIYGLDLALGCTGITIFNAETYKPVYVGSIKTTSSSFNKENEEMRNPIKLKHHFDEINKLIAMYPPTAVAIERGFTKFNTATQVIYRVHGIYNLAFAGYPNVYYPPKTVKETIYKGTAEKVELKSIIEERFDVTFTNTDESDSFAVALTYLIKNGMPWTKPRALTQKDLKSLKKPVDGSRKPRKKATPKPKAKPATVDDLFANLVDEIKKGD